MQKKLSNHIYVEILNSHDKKLIVNNFTLLELILIERTLNEIDSMSEEELRELNRE